MVKLTHEQALEAVYADRLTRHKEHDEEYVELPIALFVGKVDVGMSPLPALALYKKSSTSSQSSGKMEKLRDKDQPYSALALSVHDSVWINARDLREIKKYAEGVILSVGRPADPAFPSEKRMEVLRKSAMLVVGDLFDNPSEENIARSTKVVGSFVYVMMKDPKAYMHLAKLSSHDPYTLQHSVGAAVNSIILGRKIGINDEKDLMDLGMGGLLHDIGKVKVKKEIINKDGPLDELEWEEMRQHASEGYEIVKDSKEIDERAKLAILEHHEDRNGTGYPHGKKLDTVHVFSKVVCISDIYNALTTNRSYSKARTPFEAFQFIRDKLHHKIDEEIFKQMVMIYGGKLGD